MMTVNYIDLLKNDNITFDIIIPNEALHIIKNKYPYYKLLNFTSVFQKYVKGDKAGKVVHADFAHLYYLAEIDFRLSQILMDLCLEIETHLKARLVYDADSVCNTKTLFKEYYNSDSEYLNKTYTVENIDVLKFGNASKSLCEMELSEFLNIAQFGTLERIIHFFYSKYSTLLYESEYMSFEQYLGAVRRIRNLVAHNNSIIDKIPIKAEQSNTKMTAFLGRYGIAHKTLITNMSKPIIRDLCGLFFVYFKANKCSENFLSNIKDFDTNYCQNYKKYFEKNDLLISSYRFMKEVIQIFVKNNSKSS